MHWRALLSLVILIIGVPSNIRIIKNVHGHRYNLNINIQIIVQLAHTYTSVQFGLGKTTLGTSLFRIIIEYLSSLLFLINRIWWHASMSRECMGRWSIVESSLSRPRARVMGVTNPPKEISPFLAVQTACMWANMNEDKLTRVGIKQSEYKIIP